MISAISRQRQWEAPATFKVQSSLAKLAWKLWVKIMESQDESSLIPESQVRKELPWKAAAVRKALILRVSLL